MCWLPTIIWPVLLVRCMPDLFPKEWNLNENAEILTLELQNFNFFIQIWWKIVPIAGAVNGPVSRGLVTRLTHHTHRRHNRLNLSNSMKIHLSTSKFGAKTADFDVLIRENNFQLNLAQTIAMACPICWALRQSGVYICWPCICICCGTGCFDLTRFRMKILFQEPKLQLHARVFYFWNIIFIRISKSTMMVMCKLVCTLKFTCWSPAELPIIFPPGDPIMPVDDLTSNLNDKKNNVK